MAGSKKKVNPALVLIVGHNHTDKGASSVAPLSMDEYTYNTLVAEDAHEYGLDVGVDVHVLWKNIMGTQGVGAAASKIVKDCAAGGRVIELHFNSATPKARGCETIYDTREKGNVAFATRVRDAVVKTLGVPERKVLDRTESGRGATNIRWVTAIGCLVEPAFGSNVEDATALLRKRTAYARCLVDAALADMNG